MKLPAKKGLWVLAAIAVGLLAGCATEGGYYEGPYAYGYDYGYYGPDYYYPDSYYYGPSFFSFSFSDRDHDHFHGRTFHGSAPAPQTSTPQASAQPRFRSGTAMAHSGRGMERQPGAARFSSHERSGHFAARTTGPDREHAG